LFLKLNDQIGFQRRFGVSHKSLEILKTMIEQERYDLEDHIRAGITEKQKDIESIENTPVEESLFFYALKGALNRLAIKSTQPND
jgi:hypothetical protein